MEVEREAKVTTIAKFRDHSGFNRPVRSVQESPLFRYKNIKTPLLPAFYCLYL